MQSPAPKDYFLLALLALIWGTSYILIKKGLVVFTPYQVAGLRLGISALALTPLAVTHFRRVRWRQIPLLIVIGLTGTGLPSFLFPFAQTHLSSSLTGMLSGLTPLCTFLIAWLVFRSKDAGRRQLLGVVLGLAGALGLALAAPGEGGESTQLAYAGFIVLACFCYALSSNIVVRYFRDVSSLTITVCSFFLVGLPAIIWALSAGAVVRTVEQAELSGQPGYLALGYVAILALVSTVTASIIFFRIAQRTGAVFSSTVSYIIPLVALAWGLLDGEALSFWQVPAAAMILFGVFLSRSGSHSGKQGTSEVK